jgi:NAD(P)-dependent dehydrogenase (short-subunit alcohol dehydrogenase family)
VRGLLADRTDSEDMPYRPVILRSFAGAEAIEFSRSAQSAEGDRWPAFLRKADAPPLCVSVSPDDAAAALREQLQAAVAEHMSRHGGKPDTVCLRGMGVLQVEADTGDPRLPLHNKVALVTGAAGAIGYGVCKGLLENGCHVAATDLPGERLEGFTGELERMAPGRVIGPPLDVTDGKSVARGFESVILAWGGVDIVVVNAGLALVSTLEEMDLEAFRRLERVNVEGTLLTLSEAGRHFILQGIGGDIVIMSTKNVPSPGAGFGAYSATKAACHQLGRIASLEMAQHGVRVNMVAPDAVFAEGTHKSGLWEEVGPARMRARGLDEKGLQEYYRSRNLLKARVTGRHVANAVLFFVTRQTPTTGATIPVDGGLPDATPR